MSYSHTFPRTKRQQNCLAKALYDNVAEAPDELAFRKGDILTVLEQNTNSLEGWWLCSLRGRQGIVPGNRLRLLPGMYDPTGLGNAGTNGLSDVSHALRRSWASNPNKVVTPQKIGAVYLYDIPPGTKLDKTEFKTSSPVQRYSAQGSLAGSYDTPPSGKPVRVEAYDEPRPHPCRSPLPALSVYDSPKSNAPVSAIDQPGIHDYDIPTADQQGAYDIPRSDKDNISHIITISDNYDVPPTSYKGSPPIYDGRAFSRSSGDTSGSSSFRSPSGSHSSIETLSLSSVGGSNRSSLEQHPGDLYDIPPEPQPVLDSRMAHPQIRTSGTNVPYQSSLAQETYDIPSNNMPTQFYDTPTKPVKAQLVVDGVYDIPPQAVRDSSPVPRTDFVDSISQLSLTSSDLPDNKTSLVLPECSELLLDRESAVELLMKYQHEVQSCISKLFSFVSTTWRKYENINAKLSDIESTCHKLQSSLVDFFNFAQGTLANSAHAADKSLSFKINKLLNPIKESCTTVKNCVQTLDEKGWIASKLAYSDESYAPDELDMLVSCARNLVEDVRQIASLIQGNSTLLFKSQTISEKSKPPVAPKPNLKDRQLSSEKQPPKVQERPLPPTPANMVTPPINCGEYFNEYDYVNLESKETVEKENESIKAALPKDMCQSFDELVKQSEVPVVSHTENVPEVAPLEKTILPLDQKDVQLLLFYGVQIETHIMHLTNAIDAFLMTIKNNQPPKVFVGHSKFIIIGAHKLVYIGDSVYRNLNNPDLKTRIMHNSNSLCDSLKTLVSNTKKAASEFPSVVAVQEMVDSVVDVSHLANDLKMSINLASKS